jgi:hypothetical protein
MTPQAPSVDETGARLLAAPLLAARLVEALGGLDLTSADGRAGIGALLSEIERLSPGAVLQQAARIELRALGWSRSSSEAPRAER